MLGTAIRGFVAVLSTIVAATLLSAAPASAHTQLVRSDPRPMSTVHAAPDEVTLWFAARPAAVSVSVTDAEKRSIRRGKVQITGRSVVAGLTTKTAPGWFTVRYRARAVDGHVVTGTIRYRVSTQA